MPSLSKRIPCCAKGCKNYYPTVSLLTAHHINKEPRGVCKTCLSGYIYCPEHIDHDHTHDKAMGDYKLETIIGKLKASYENPDYDCPVEGMTQWTLPQGVKREQPDSGHDEAGRSRSQPPQPAAAPPAAAPSSSHPQPDSGHEEARPSNSHPPAAAPPTINAKWARCTPVERKAIILSMFIVFGIVTGDPGSIDSQLDDLESKLTRDRRDITQHNRNLADPKCTSCNTSIFAWGYLSTDEQNPGVIYCDECGEGKDNVEGIRVLNNPAVKTTMAIMRQHRQYLGMGDSTVISDFAPDFTRMPSTTDGATIENKMYVTMPQLKSLLESLDITALSGLLEKVRNELGSEHTGLRGTFTALLNKGGTKKQYIEKLIKAVVEKQYLSFNPESIQTSGVLQQFIEKFRGTYWGMRDDDDFFYTLTDVNNSTLVLIGVKDTGTRWHCDRTHARNVAFALLFGTNEEFRRVLLAVWTLVNPLYADEVDSKMKELYTTYYTNGTGTTEEKEKYLAFKDGFKSGTHLTEKLAIMLQEECGVDPVTNTYKVKIIHQCAGDIVTVPAGWIHCVCNVSQCVKIAYDYIVPEHMPLYMLGWRKIHAHLTNSLEDFGCVAEILHTIVRA